MALSKTSKTAADLSDGKRSGYFYEGKEIITGRRRGRPPTYIRNPSHYPQDVKVDAATVYAVYGDVVQVSTLTDVPASVIRGWKQEPWWIEIQKQVYTEQNERLAARISGVLDKTITHLEDRLENGDEVLSNKTGEIVIKKVDASVLAKMFENLAHQRRITRGEPTSISAKVGVNDRLKTLETAFLKFAKARDITPVVNEQDIEDIEYEDQDRDAPPSSKEDEEQGEGDFIQEETYSES
jgi:hypothetical protein